MNVFMLVQHGPASIRIYDSQVKGTQFTTEKWMDVCSRLNRRCKTLKIVIFSEIIISIPMEWFHYKAAEIEFLA